LKTALIVFLIIIIGLIGFFGIGFYSMIIEDRYGVNQDIFYYSNHGDIVINHDTKELGEISKTWTRFYVIHKKDTIDIYDWWDDKNIEIYRSSNKAVISRNILYSNIQQMKKGNEVELKHKLR
jgi:hypothetical protein